MGEPAVAVLAKAPIPGFAKTRLISVLGAERAAILQERFIERAVATALGAAIGPVTLWCTPDVEHPSFQDLAWRYGIQLALQPPGDLGERMLTAFQAAPTGKGLVLMGTDCPVIAPSDLRDAAARLADAEVVIAPAEDGGYGLIAAIRPIPGLFRRMPWGSDQVAALTRQRARLGGVHLAELRTVWDVDTAADVERLWGTSLVDLAGIRPQWQSATSNWARP
jgi:rSAM/selenodomain-associated transferase 1